MMIDSFARAILLLNSESVIWPFILIGLCFIDRLKFTHVLAITLFALAYNPFLKSIFLIPLNPEIGKIGFSFPSGHTQIAVSCYGTVFILFKNKIMRATIVCLLMLIFWGMVHFRYHTWTDIIAGVGFTVLFQGLYFFILAKVEKSNDYILHALMLIVCFLFILFIYYRAWIPDHMWFSVYGLSALTIIKFLFQKKKLGPDH